MTNLLITPEYILCNVSRTFCGKLDKTAVHSCFVEKLFQITADSQIKVLEGVWFQEISLVCHYTKIISTKDVLLGVIFNILYNTQLQGVSYFDFSKYPYNLQSILGCLLTCCKFSAIAHAMLLFCRYLHNFVIWFSLVALVSSICRLMLLGW